MSTKPNERVADLLTETEAAFESLDDDVTGKDALEEMDEAELQSLATEAKDLFETNDPETVLEAVGLSASSEEGETASIPAAIASGSTEAVVDLRSMLTLAKLAGEWGDEEALEQTLPELRSLLEERAEVRSGDDSDGVEGGDGNGDAAETRADDEERSEDGDSKDAGGIESTIRSTMGEAVGEFSDEVQTVRERLEQVAADEGEEATAADEGEEVIAEDEGGETAAEDEGEETAAEDEEREGEPGEADETAADETAAEDEEDGGLFGDLGDSPKRSTMYSTMARSPSERSDMRGVSRFSTVPDRT